MLEVELCDRALLDLRSIQLHYLLNASEKAAAKHLAEIKKGIEMVATMPSLGAAFDDPRGNIGPGYQRYLTADFWIYYSVSTKDKITIWRAFHTKQEIDDYAFIDF